MDQNLGLLGWLCPGTVAPPGGMLAVGSDVAVVVHSAGSSAVVVAASVHWVNT
jgi:hypothetical protein